MAVFLPLANLGCMVMLFHRIFPNHSPLLALARSLVLWFALLTVLTELLSLFRSLNQLFLAAGWTIVLILQLVLLVRQPRSFGNKSITKSTSSGTIRIAVVVLCSILALTLATALLYPPNTWDSMTYHMSRVAHWLDRETVAFYPTAITRQYYQFPLAEYAILQFQALSGSDLFANLVQWLSFLSLPFLLMGLVMELRGGRMARWLTAIAACTLPMAVLQASSTQNDLVLSALTAAFVLFLLRWRRRQRLEEALFCGLALGTALLTKGTAYIYCAGLGIVLILPLLVRQIGRRSCLRRTVLQLILILMTAGIFSTAHINRNLALSGSPFSRQGRAYWNGELSIPVLWSNLLRNAALHLGTGSGALNRAVENSVAFLTGPYLNSPLCTWMGTRFRVGQSQHEDTAANSWHFILLLWSIAATFAAKSAIRVRQCHLALAVVFAALGFCLVLKWQPWASRLHTPLFLLAMPLLGLRVHTLWEKKRGLALLLTTAVVLGALPYLFRNKSRPLSDLKGLGKTRIEKYFVNRSDLYLESVQINMQLTHRLGRGKVGLLLQEDDWEYQFWVLAGSHTGNRKGIRFRHIAVPNPSRRLGKQSAFPRFAIAGKHNWKQAADLGYKALYTGSWYQLLELVHPRPKQH